MISLQKIGDSAVKFVFTDSDHYLYGNGEIEVPVNSLLLVIDESDMVTFKKLSGDPFLSFRADNSNLGTKAAIEQFYKDNMVGSTGGGGSGSGVTPSEVQEMIDESISGKADTSDVTAVANDVSTLSGQVATKVATSDFNAYSAATDSRLAEDEEVTAAALNDLDERIGDPYQKVSGLTIETDEEEDFPFIRIEKEFEDGNSNYTYINDAALESTFDNNADGSIYSSYVGQGSIGNSAVDFPDDNVTSERSFNISTDGFEQTTFENVDDGESQYTRYSSENRFEYSNGLTLSQQWYDDENDTTTNSNINIINNRDGETYINLNDGTNILELNTSNFDWTDGSDSRMVEWKYIASLVDVNDAVSGKVDTSAITSAITSGSTDDEIPTAKAVYDATQSGGGGATYSAGTNISIDTGNTISCTLPITNTKTNEYFFGAKKLKICNNIDNVTVPTGNYVGFAMGDGARSTGVYSFTFGNNVYAKQYCTAAIGYYLNAENQYETALGKANVSNTGSTESGQTLFSVGNGTTSVRHNAFEIRQNGDIYVNDGTNDVRLQDTILALGGLKLVKLTQNEYDQLATKDPDTLYIISNVVS